MSTFVKKATSAVAGLAVVFSMVSPIAGVSAALSGVEAANQLATLGVVVDQSANPADYRLGDNLPRKEAVKVMMNLSSVAVVDNCSGQFSDLTSADWACKYAETALANGLVAANASFRPDDLVSKIEALKMVFQGMDLERDDNADWRAGYVEAAVSMGIATSFSDYDTPATRAEMFVWAAEAINMDDEVATEDPLCDLLGICEEEGTDEGTGEAEGENEEGTPTTPTVSGGLEVTLSPNTPAATTIPGGVNGLRVAAYDVTAGSSDVTVNQVSVKRTGLSDEDTLDQIAIFTDAGRVSNAKSDNQDNDTTAQINLDNGGLVVEAGETVTMFVVVDVNKVEEWNGIDGDVFAMELVDIRSNSSDVNLNGNLRASSMTVGSINAPELVIKTSGTVSNPNLGEQGADIFEFEIEGANDEDVVLQSITFEANGDAEDDLRNFELLMGNKVVATTQRMSGDYLTFVIDGGLEIEEDKNEDFTVTADVLDGAGDEIEFRIDERLDVRGDSTKFGFGAAADITAVENFGDLGTIEIEAGELTIIEVEAPNDEIREDKDNVVLGGFQIINLSNESLELENFGVEISLSSTGSAFVDTNADDVQNGTESIAAASVFEDVELYNVETGSSYELDAASDTALTTLFSDNNIDSVIASGTTNWEIRADTAEDIFAFNDVKIDLEINVDSDVRIIETMDDERVTDITPSILSFNSIDGSESGAQVSLNPLANIDVVRGAQDVTALSFEVEAEDSSAITIDEMTVRVLGSGAVAATRQQVTAIKLYEGSVSTANILDTVSGSDIGTNGDVTFDDMDDVIIAANGMNDFIVTVSIADSSNAEAGSAYTVRLTDISIEDDENDDIEVALGAGLVSARSITVNGSGVIQTVFLDTANEDNEFDKLALAGDSSVIASFDVRADNEEIDVETATFTIDGYSNGGSLRDTVTSATLLLNGVAIETNSNSDITNTTITFEDLENLIIPEQTAELALQLNTANIGDDETGESITGLTITRLVLSDAEGVESGKDLSTDGDSGVVLSRSMDIVSAVVTPSVVSTLGTDDQTAELRLVVDGGNNTNAAGDAVQAELTQLTINVSSVTAAGTVTVFNGNGTEVGTATVAATPATQTITVAIDDASGTAGDSIGNDNEVYRIEATGEAIYRLARAGVTYTTNGTDPVSTKLENTLLLGQYADSN